MIRREDNEEWILITQHDHAVLAGEIIARWGNGVFSAPRPPDEVIFAVSEHDCGWKEWDSSPRINPENGYPANFMEMEPHDQYDIWKRSYLAHSVGHPYASSLIALHFARFNEKSLNKNPGNGSAKALENEIKRFVAEKLGIPPEDTEPDRLPGDVKINLRFVQIGDIISLTLCHGWQSMEIPGVPLDYEGRTSKLNIASPDGFNFVVDPYPFSEDILSFSITGRRLSRKTFADDADLRRSLESVPPCKLDFTVRKG